MLRGRAAWGPEQLSIYKTLSPVSFKLCASPLKKKAIPVESGLDHSPCHPSHGDLGRRTETGSQDRAGAAGRGRGAGGEAAGETPALPVGAALLDAHDIQVLGQVSLGWQQELVQVRGQLLRKGSCWQGLQGPHSGGSAPGHP